MANTSPFTDRYTAQVPAQGTAGTAQATIIDRMRVAGTVTAAGLIPTGAVAADGTDYRVWTIYNRGTSGSGTTVVATLSTLSSAEGALTDNDEKAFTLSGTAANLVVAEGDVLEVAETVGGSGKTHTGGKLFIKVRPDC
ncbi:MAG: hypothetical protein E6R03_01775 [Hyphomicrobiaceae bacterium]|nr:MAG: hypothetical protein E6R03_01775 [Hyphomicrobiaceae bacterium]